MKEIHRYHHHHHQQQLKVKVKVKVKVNGRQTERRWGRRLQTEKAASTSERQSASGSGLGCVKYLYDGECPVRGQERKTLEQLDRGKGQIYFVDISAADYDAKEHLDLTYEEAMRQPLAITKEGEVVRGVDVYRVLYEAVGFGFVWKLAEIPGIKQAVDFVFRFWSENRLAITGRPPLEKILQEREGDGREGGEESDAPPAGQADDL